jgi:hypothetical protein
MIVHWLLLLPPVLLLLLLLLLLQFVAQERRIPAQREEHCGVRIGAWCNKRRLQYKQGSMPLDRIAALEAVEGWWWTADDMPEL